MAVITIPTPTLLVSFANSGFAPKNATNLIVAGSVASLFSDLATKTIGIGIMPATGGGGGGAQGSISFN